MHGDGCIVRTYAASPALGIIQAKDSSSSIRYFICTLCRFCQCRHQVPGCRPATVHAGHYLACLSLDAVLTDNQSINRCRYIPTQRTSDNGDTHPGPRRRVVGLSGGARRGGANDRDKRETVLRLRLTQVSKGGRRRVTSYYISCKEVITPAATRPSCSAPKILGRRCLRPIPNW